MSKGMKIVLAVVAVLLLLALMAFSGYMDRRNTMVSQKEAIKAMTS